MYMRKLKPRLYLNEFFPEANYSTRTVRNWIKSGKIKGEQSPSGGWLVLINPQEQSKASQLLGLLEAVGK